MTRKKESKKGETDMMKRVTVEKGAQCTVDLTKIEGDGSFPCPRCGTVISPEDESEKVYTILDTKTYNDELVELVISCGTCGTTIRLGGFQQAVGDLASE